MKPVSSEVYWLRRSLANSAKAINFSEVKLLHLRKRYRNAIREIDKEIAEFYVKYGKDGKVSSAEASIPVRGKYRITRLEQLKRRITQHIDTVFGVEENIAKDILSSVYEGAYYRSIYEIQRYIGAGRHFALLTPHAVDQAISTAWSGHSYSERIWTRKKKLAQAVDDIVTNGVVLGHSNQKMATRLADRMNASYSRAKQLIRTETNYVYNQGTLQGYEAAGLEEYQFLATLDMRTSEDCQSLDGKRFKIKDAQPGLNFPPMHPNCRSTTIPYFADIDFEAERRIARSGDGTSYLVPGRMTYPEWLRKYVA